MKKILAEFNISRNIDNNCVTSFFVTFFIGAISYFYIGYNTLLAGDDFAYLYDYTNSAGSWATRNGRFLRAIIDEILMYLKFNRLIPMFQIIVGLMFLSIAYSLIIKIFQVKKLVPLLLLSFTVIFPVWSETFLFVRDVVAYTFSFFLSVLSVYFLVSKYKFRHIVSALCIFASISIYQTYFEFALSLYVLYEIFDFLVIYGKNKEYDIKKNCYKILKNLIVYFIVALVYLIVVNFVIGLQSVTGERLIENYSFLHKIIKMFAAFFVLPFKNYMDINYSIMSKVFILVLYVLILYSLIKIILNMKMVFKIYFIFLLFMFLSFFNINYLLQDTIMVRTIPSQIYLLLIPALILNISDNNNGIMKIGKELIYLSSIIILVSNFYYANGKIYDTKKVQDATRTYFTQLVTSIRNVEGYTVDDKVAVIQLTSGSFFTGQVLDDYFVDKGAFGNSPAYNIADAGWTWQNVFKTYGAYDLKLVDQETYDNLLLDSDVENMPTYPNYGSIIRKNNIIIIRIN